MLQGDHTQKPKKSPSESSEVEKKYTYTVSLDSYWDTVLRNRNGRYSVNHEKAPFFLQSETKPASSSRPKVASIATLLESPLNQMTQQQLIRVLSAKGEIAQIEDELAQVEGPVAPSKEAPVPKDAPLAVEGEIAHIEGEPAHVEAPFALFDQVLAPEDDPLTVEGEVAQPEDELAQIEGAPAEAADAPKQIGAAPPAEAKHALSPRLINQEGPKDNNVIVSCLCVRGPALLHPKEQLKAHFNSNGYNILTVSVPNQEIAQDAKKEYTYFVQLPTRVAAEIAMNDPQNKSMNGNTLKITWAQYDLLDEKPCPYYSRRRKTCLFGDQCRLRHDAKQRPKQNEPLRLQELPDISAILPLNFPYKTFPANTVAGLEAQPLSDPLFGSQAQAASSESKHAAGTSGSPALVSSSSPVTKPAETQIPSSLMSSQSPATKPAETPSSLSSSLSPETKPAMIQTSFAGASASPAIGLFTPSPASALTSIAGAAQTLTSAAKKNYLLWTTDEVAAWVSQIDMHKDFKEQVVALFKEYKITGKILSKLDDEGLKAMEISRAIIRAQIRKAIIALKKQAAQLSHDLSVRSPHH